MSKISELSDGGSLVSTDYLIAVRSGGNVKVRMDEINVDQVDLGDNEFIRLGNSQDLTLVHNASNSIINQAGIGDLLIQKAGSTKLTVNSTGIDVTGSVTADGLTVDDVVSIDTSTGNAFSSTGNLKIDIDSDNNQTDRTFQITSDGSSKTLFQAEEGGDISFYEDTGTTAKFFWDASAERLGLGTTSALADLHIVNSAAAQFLLEAGDSSTATILFGDSADTNIGWIQYDNSDNNMNFRTNNTEAMRIDASGNLLVGKTSASGSTVGGEIRATGAVLAVRDGDFAGYFNRKTSDGEIVRFVKDTTTVGSIGVDNNDNFYIGATTSGHSGFYFGNTNVAPMAAGTKVDNTIDLGSSSTRFKDLYLSGGVQLGAGNNISWGGAYGAGIPTISAGSGFFAFYPNGSTSGESMRLDASGNLLVGKTATSFGTDGFQANADGQIWATNASASVTAFNRRTTDGAISVFYKDGVTVGSIGTTTNSYNYFSGPNTGIFCYNAGVGPTSGDGVLSDNAKDLGAATNRWDDIYATNGTIQTSDRNEKQDIEALSDAEQRVAVAAKGLLRKFRWKSSVAENGDEARTHFGIIAQDLQAAFEAEGLDAGRYAMFINSTWTDEETGEERSRMGVRYSELLAFIIAAI